MKKNDNMSKNIDRESVFDTEIEMEESLVEKLKTVIKQNKLAFFSLIVIFIIIFCAVFANVICAYGPNAQSLKDRLLAPSFAHPLGTDELGRDTLTRVIYGARISLTIGLLPTFISMTIGTILGLIAGYFGGKIDFAIPITFTCNGCNVYHGWGTYKYIYSIIFGKLGIYIQSNTFGNIVTFKERIC